ncbi:MAG: U32 family peptidase, partial [Angelakisella sp.]
MEILAPVGGSEQLLAAVRSGANAVYLGSKGFNARRNAQNFDREGLARAVRYCHGRGAAVHVTLNTLFTDDETLRLVDEIELIATSGADAVIVQDMGVAALVRSCCPTLAMHASTQLSVHSVAGALFMKEMGFSRLVLARELTAAEIKEIKDKSGLEVEVFVHGALCMSMSGNCYLSALLGERSGNRGLCAQPCRLNFIARGREYALSLKDLSLIEQMDELVAAGVDSIKIEGRMKRPEYVSAAVTACKQKLAGEQPDMEKLQAVFSRSGFTDGYFAGKRDVNMFGYRRKEDVTAAAGVLGELAAVYRGENPLIPIAMKFTMKYDCPVTHSVTLSGEPPQKAINRPTDIELVRRGAEKLGGTPFLLRQLKAELDDGLMVPISAINSLRSAAAQQLLAAREETKPHQFTPPAKLPRCGEAKGGAVELCLRLESAEQLTERVLTRAAQITLPLW